jgi:hypothetical protein
MPNYKLTVLVEAPDEATVYNTVLTALVEAHRKKDIIGFHYSDVTIDSNIYKKCNE